MYSTVTTAILQGIDSKLVQVEVDICEGMPMFEMVGYLSAEVKEAKERVRTALKNCQHPLPIKRITVNMHPANVKKSGTGFDLPIAVAILSALNQCHICNAHEYVMVGEVALDGTILPVCGVLPIAMEAKKQGKKYLLLPKENVNEALEVEGLVVYGISHLEELFQTNQWNPEEPIRSGYHKPDYSEDFSDIHGQKILKRACEVAISGMHSMLMVGPPGAGKTMIAKRIPTILPDLTKEELLELSKIYSVCGKYDELQSKYGQRPFRNPHHSVTEQGMIGGGIRPKPGEISLAHRGILFLDELTEFKKNTIELLRQPIEDKKITITRNSGCYQFPADFLLVAAMNPCNCGYFPDRNRCHCSKPEIIRYLNKLSQPFLDRLDLCVEAEPLSYIDLTDCKKEEDSATIRKRVELVHQRQKKRYEKMGYLFNSQLSAKDIRIWCHLEKQEEEYMQYMYEKKNLTARTYHKVLKVARTIADMAGEEKITLSHLQEAICYRGMEKATWEKNL